MSYFSTRYASRVGQRWILESVFRSSTVVKWGTGLLHWSSSVFVGLLLLLCYKEDHPLASGRSEANSDSAIHVVPARFAVLVGIYYTTCTVGN